MGASWDEHVGNMSEANEDGSKVQNVSTIEDGHIGEEEEEEDKEEHMENTQIVEESIVGPEPEQSLAEKYLALVLELEVARKALVAERALHGEREEQHEAEVAALRVRLAELECPPSRATSTPLPAPCLARSLTLPSGSFLAALDPAGR
jgi:hypothetical protein